VPGNGHFLAKTSFECRSVSREILDIDPEEEPIPMLDDKGNPVGKPALDMVIAEHSAVLRLCGRIDIDSSPALRDRFLVLFKAPPAKVVNIDLSAVTHIDSSGVATLIETLRMARSHNVEVSLQGLEGRLLGLFQSTGILSLFNETRPTTESRSKRV
jgi:anti-anti-sigma factor